MSSLPASAALLPTNACRARQRRGVFRRVYTSCAAIPADRLVFGIGETMGGQWSDGKNQTAMMVGHLRGGIVAAARLSQPAEEASGH